MSARTSHTSVDLFNNTYTTVPRYCTRPRSHAVVTEYSRDLFVVLRKCRETTNSLKTSSSPAHPSWDWPWRFNPCWILEMTQPLWPFMYTHWLRDRTRFCKTNSPVSRHACLPGVQGLSCSESLPAPWHRTHFRCWSGREGCRQKLKDKQS